MKTRPAMNQVSQERLTDLLKKHHLSAEKLLAIESIKNFLSIEREQVDCFLDALRIISEELPGTLPSLADHPMSNSIFNILLKLNTRNDDENLIKYFASFCEKLLHNIFPTFFQELENSIKTSNVLETRNFIKKLLYTHDTHTSFFHYFLNWNKPAISPIKNNLMLEMLSTIKINKIKEIKEIININKEDSEPNTNFNETLFAAIHTMLNQKNLSNIEKLVKIKTLISLENKKITKFNTKFKKISHLLTNNNTLFKNDNINTDMNTFLQNICLDSNIPTWIFIKKTNKDEEILDGLTEWKINYSKINLQPSLEKIKNDIERGLNFEGIKKDTTSLAADLEKFIDKSHYLPEEKNLIKNWFMNNGHQGIANFLSIFMNHYYTDIQWTLAHDKLLWQVKEDGDIYFTCDFHIKKYLIEGEEQKITSIEDYLILGHAELMLVINNNTVEPCLKEFQIINFTEELKAPLQYQQEKMAAIHSFAKK